jgi:redox-sensitive bicupin YhaK (pirin superfamily)
MLAGEGLTVLNYTINIGLVVYKRDQEMVMTKIRPIERLARSRATIEGAGVHLKRAFGYSDVPWFDPFLMLDDFHSDRPADYMAGFPWHPHRGIETVTYMISGEVEHGDSMGNKGVIQSGEVQWMTAGSGIVHQEMPRRQKGTLWGLQLWVNLPASHKMMGPRYHDLRAADIPACPLASGAVVKVVAGSFNGCRGPVRDLIGDPEYLDVTLPGSVVFEHGIAVGNTVFAYLLEGEGRFEPRQKNPAGTESLLLMSDGDKVSIEAEKAGLRFILVSGRPLREPVAWRGPIVMNTEEELDVAFAEYRNGTFIKS